MSPELTLEERAAALRFCETCQDDEGYDVPRPMMKRLAELGLVEYKGFGRYEQTDTILKLESDHMDVDRAKRGSINLVKPERKI